ncbi:site-specific integrase [Photobacterium profundum]|uniref:Tyr recombinase domain-containing protein n=1 Tax=Photobacterium profundum 3TCK TaxID=314280 RepID=Q1Z828_9GAMM|nr:DUF3596 domain-containing protein [Photobacterium profundum]EAS44685.1 hypothetical protein P3TCK_26967 [Photobacterium profundum 3TCK]PSV60674.1 site-specific integrase [Photobacterium profundum]
MAKIRVRPNGVIQYDLCVYGVRFRETSGLSATPYNLKKTKAVLKRLNAELALGSFDYKDFFPDSKKVEKFQLLKRAKNPALSTPYFDTFSQEWLARQTHEWKNSYRINVISILKNYLLPAFGDKIMNTITFKDVQTLRSQLCELTKKDGSRKLSNKRINIILVPLISLLHIAADEHDFPYPLERLKPLREEASDPNPMTQDEVNSFLATVAPQWRDYYLIRFHTGMRSCEVHGLMKDCVDFTHDLIRVRRNWVNGELTDVKTPKSNREIVMTATVKAALQRAVEKTNGQFVFTHPKGFPLDTRYVNKYLWYPTLIKANLAKRRPYETRHTAAVLHLAAHENPLYVSRLLGHSSTRMLYEVYAPYVINAARQDGSAFDAMMQGGQ